MALFSKKKQSNWQPIQLLNLLFIVPKIFSLEIFPKVMHKIDASQNQGKYFFFSLKLIYIGRGECLLDLPLTFLNLLCI